MIREQWQFWSFTGLNSIFTLFFKIIKKKDYFISDYCLHSASISLGSWSRIIDKGSMKVSVGKV